MPMSKLTLGNQIRIAFTTLVVIILLCSTIFSVISIVTDSVDKVKISAGCERQSFILYSNWRKKAARGTLAGIFGARK